MPLDLFAAGNFSAWDPVVEWNGTNHGEIRDWIQSLDPQNPTDPAARWFVSAVDSGHVTFTRPVEHPGSFGIVRHVTLAVGEWLTAVNQVTGPPLAVLRVDPAGKWKTSDPYGRPEDLNDLLP